MEQLCEYSPEDAALVAAVAAFQARLSPAPWLPPLVADADVPGAVSLRPVTLRLAEEL